MVGTANLRPVRELLVVVHMWLLFCGFLYTIGIIQMDRENVENTIITWKKYNYGQMKNQRLILQAAIVFCRKIFDSFFSP